MLKNKTNFFIILGKNILDFYFSNLVLGSRGGSDLVKPTPNNELEFLQKDQLGNSTQNSGHTWTYLTKQDNSVICSVRCRN